jgi:hypothetical protein
MGVLAGKTRRDQFLGLALLGFARVLLIATGYFQSGFLKRPNASGKPRRSAKRGGDRQLKAGGVGLTNRLGWRQARGGAA